MKQTVLLLAGLAIASTAHAQIEVSFRNGAVRNLPSFQLQDGRLVLPDEAVRVDPAQITEVRFLFDGSVPPKATTLFLEGRSPAAAEKLAPFAASMHAAATFPGNTTEILQLWVRVCFHTDNFSGMREAISALRRAGSPFVQQTTPYEILALIGEGKVDEARQAQAVTPVEGAAGWLIRALLAEADGQEKDALRYLSRLHAFYFNQTEWMPAALLAETRLRIQSGNSVAADYALRELQTFFPESLPARKAAALANPIEPTTERGI